LEGKCVEPKKTSSDITKTSSDKQNLVQNNIQALTDDKICVSIKSGEITKVQMKFWIDGWDGDCFDEISGYTDEEGIQHEVVPINIQLLFNSKKVD